MKYHYAFQIILAILGIAFPIQLPGADFSDTSAIENRLAKVESRVDAIETKLEESPGCISNDRIIEIYAANEAEIYAIWEAGGPGMTMRAAVIQWLKSQEGKTRISTEEIYSVYAEHRFEVVEILLESPKLSLADAVERFIERGGLDKPKERSVVKKPVKSSVTVQTRRGPGHTHRCSRCGASWSHENFNRGNSSAHTCPSCGNLEWGNRTEGWRSQPARQWQPVRIYSSAPSFQSCPGGVCPIR